jgi:hypothetical protein
MPSHMVRIHSTIGLYKVRVPLEDASWHHLTLPCRIAGGTYDYGSIVALHTAIWSLAHSKSMNQIRIQSPGELSSVRRFFGFNKIGHCNDPGLSPVHRTYCFTGVLVIRSP